MILTDQLRKENETIRMILKILERMSEKIDSGMQLNPEDLTDAVELAGVLVERLHQKKEEALLVSTMEESPVDEHGALALLLSEHRAIRRSFQEMKESATMYLAGDQSARPLVSKTLRVYSEQLGRHLETVESDLYGRADIHLSRKRQYELIDRFSRLDRSDGDRDVQLQSLRKLRRDYLR
jgi:hemerythrin-like domain-containing protein